MPDERVCGANGEAKLNDKTEKLGVRCCGTELSVTAGGGSWREGGGSWYTNGAGEEVDCSTPPNSCLEKNNNMEWKDIADACAAMGRRPCTVAELKTTREDGEMLLCRGTGGQCDNRCVWTADEEGQEADASSSTSTGGEESTGAAAGGDDESTADAPATETETASSSTGIVIGVVLAVVVLGGVGAALGLAEGGGGGGGGGEGAVMVII
eukprot:g18089.t1